MEEKRIKNYPNYNDYPEGAGVSGNGLKTNQEAIDGEGFTTGNTSVEDYQNQGSRTWNREADPNSFIFRYGLFFDNYSNIEDPTLLGFTIELDDSNNSPLFADINTPYSAAKFIDVYKNMPEIASRKEILEEFQKNIKMFFKSQNSSQTNAKDLPYVKSHYINGISSMGNLAKKIVDYPEDTLTFNLYEDVTMHSQYLAQLYNNLAYSYRNQKTLIPEDLLRFNMNIKVSEIRNFKTVAKKILDSSPEEQKKYVVNVNSSQLVYKLYGCNFIFFDSINHGESMTQAGLGASRTENKDLELKLKYKAVNRFFKSTFLEDLDTQSNSRLPLNDRELNPIEKLTQESFFGNQTELLKGSTRANGGTSDNSKSGNISDSERDNNTRINGYSQDSAPTGTKTSSKSDKWKKKQIDKIKGGFNNTIKGLESSANKFVNNEKKVLMSEIKKVENKVLEQIRRKKGELLNNLIKDIKKNVGLIQISPKNVYYGNQTNTVLQNFTNQLGSGIAHAAVDFLKNVSNNIGP